MLIDAMEHGGDESGATASDVEGPLYVDDPPWREAPVKVYEDYEGMGDADVLFVRGSVTSTDGTPLPDAVIDIWQTGPNGGYDIWDERQPEFNFRGRWRVEDEGGAYEFQTMLPKPYTVPTDGPVGRYLEAVGQHPWRPAHIHFKVTAPGHQPLVTQVFFPDDPYLENDTIGAVKAALVRPVRAGGRPPGLPVRHRAAAGRLSRFASCSLGERRFAALVDGDTVRPLDGRHRARPRDPGRGARGSAAERRAHRRSADVTLLPVVPHPGKVVCVGLNYKAHVEEGVYDVPDYPALFSKFAETLVGAGQPVLLPPESEAVDYEAELAFVIGREVRRVERRRGARRGRRLHPRQRRHDARLPVQDAPMAAGQELGGLDAARPVPRHAGRGRRPALARHLARAQRRAHAGRRTRACSSSTSRRWWRRSPSSSRSRPATWC